MYAVAEAAETVHGAACAKTAYTKAAGAMPKAAHPAAEATETVEPHGPRRSLQDACRCHGRQNGNRQAQGLAKSGGHSASWPSVVVCWRQNVVPRLKTIYRGNFLFRLGRTLLRFVSRTNGNDGGISGRISGAEFGR